MSDILIRASEPEDVPDLTEAMNQPRAVWGTMQVPFTSVATRREGRCSHIAWRRVRRVLNCPAAQRRITKTEPEARDGSVHARCRRTRRGDGTVGVRQVHTAQAE